MSPALRVLLAATLAFACKNEDAAHRPASPPYGFEPWIARTFDQPRCRFAVLEVPSHENVRVQATFTNRPGNPANSWDFPLIFHRSGNDWDCYRDDNPELRCELTMIQCEQAVAPATATDVATSNPAKTAPRCMTTSKKLIKQGTSCGLNMSRYTPDKICAYYLTTEHLADADIVRRLDVFLASGCDGLRSAVAGDRI